MDVIAWTPPNSKRGLGRVLLRPPVVELDRTQYKLALLNRIDRLIKRTDPAEAKRLLSQYGHLEGFDLQPETAAEVLADNSSDLMRATGFPLQGIKGPIQNDPEVASGLEEETLEEFLADLYPPED